MQKTCYLRTRTCTNLQKTLTMLIEKRYKDEDTGSDGVNSLPKLELSYSSGVYFFIKTKKDNYQLGNKEFTTKFEEEPSFAGDGISNQERECVGLRKRASVSGIRNNDTAYFQLLAYVSRNYHVPLYSRL